MPLSPFHLLPRMPGGLEGLIDLALDMRFSWSHATDCLWMRIDPELWRTTHNPWLILQTTAASHLDELADDPAFVDEVAKQIHCHRLAMESESWFERSENRESFNFVAYFCMEYGLAEALPIYSGGLGILAGDYLKAASDIGLPVAGIGLLYQQGYFRQIVDMHGNQLEFFPFNNPIQLPVMPVRNSHGEWVHVRIPLPGRSLRLQVWQTIVGRARLYLLDSNTPLNSPADRGLTSELYGGGSEMRLLQEMILGIGGARMLQALGLQADIFHLNEGHAAFAVLERARIFAKTHACALDTALTATRAGNMFTTHTPVAAGFDRFSPELMYHYMPAYCAELGQGVESVIALGRVDPASDRGPFNMAVLAMHGCGVVNGVSRLHGEVSRKIFQPLFPRWPRSEVPIGHVTNGIHVPSWDSAGADSLWTRACGKERWLGKMDRLTEEIQALPDEALWTLRTRARKQFVHFVRHEHTRQLTADGMSTGKPVAMDSMLDPNALTLCFARRFAAYKRPNLLLSDPVRLARMLSSRDNPLQLVIAGKAHPRDEPGKTMIREWIAFIHEYHLETNVIFLSDYDMVMAEQMVQGTDVWLNTPRRPWEACGTSGMKVLVNGGLNLSELDGWWAEAYAPEVGWAIGDGREHDSDPGWDTTEANEIYRLLENEIIPCFYERDEHGIPVRWVSRMRASMAELTPRFSCNRMLQEYAANYYRPMAAAWRKRAAEKHQLADEINVWRNRLACHWQNLHFGNVSHHEKDGMNAFEIQVYLDELEKDDVLVQLYADSAGEGENECITMQREEPLAGAVNGYVFRAAFPATRPALDYTPRIIPHHPDAMVPIEANQILWLK